MSDDVELIAKMGKPGSCRFKRNPGIPPEFDRVLEDKNRQEGPYGTFPSLENRHLKTFDVHLDKIQVPQALCRCNMIQCPHLDFYGNRKICSFARA